MAARRAVCLLPLALLGIVWLMDTLPVSHDGILAIGLVDEPAHLSTALIVLLAFGGRILPLQHKVFFGCAALGAVLIDVDHIPMYAGVPHIRQPGGRPYSHSLATPLVLAVLAVCIARWRPALAGLAVGVLLHFVRDLGTGPGLPLWWPFDDTSHSVPYAGYFTGIACLAGIAVMRLYFQEPTPMAAASGLDSEAE